MEISNNDKNNQNAGQCDNAHNNEHVDPYKIYDKIINEDNDISDYEIMQLNGTVSAVRAENLDDLKLIIDFYSEYYPDASLNWLDVSNIADMSYLFYNTLYIGNISGWNVSNVKNMEYMFFGSKFNGDISSWDVSNVKNMIGMFWDSVFTGDISHWDVSDVTNMSFMFYGSYFDGDISEWDVSDVENMEYMFYSSHFTNDISKWHVSHVMFYSDIFTDCLIPEKHKPKFKNKLII